MKRLPLLAFLLCVSCTTLPLPAQSSLPPAPAADTLSPTPTVTSLPSVTVTSSPQPTGFSSYPLTRVPVVRDVDGGTIPVMYAGKKEYVRIIGMDTPETVKPDTPVQWMGPEASAETKRLVDGQTVSLEKDTSERDTFGRLLRYVYLPDGRMLDELLVCEGLARVIAYPPDLRYQTCFDNCQRSAQAAHLGLWSKQT